MTEILLEFMDLNGGDCKMDIYAVAGTKRDRFYIYIKLILLAPACTVVQQTDNGCNNNTVDNTNTNDTVYNIYKVSRD